MRVPQTRLSTRCRESIQVNTMPTMRYDSWLTIIATTASGDVVKATVWGSSNHTIHQANQVFVHLSTEPRLNVSENLLNDPFAGPDIYNASVRESCIGPSDHSLPQGLNIFSILNITNSLAGQQTREFILDPIGRPSTSARVSSSANSSSTLVLRYRSPVGSFRFTMISPSATLGPTNELNRCCPTSDPSSTIKDDRSM